jgi:voltage-gated potassium channel
MGERSFREKIRFYLIDCKTPPGKLTDAFIIFLNLVICTLFVIETYNISIAARRFLFLLEIIIVAFFIIEYAARLYGADNRLKHIFDIYSIIDLIAILPTVSLLFIPISVVNIRFIRIIRVFRVFRIFRFLRFTISNKFFFGDITVSLLKVVRLLLTILIIFFISSGLFWHVESPVNENVSTFGDAFYFTVVALTTVGFGDITPVSEAGRWITVLMILSGILFIPWQASQIVKEWMHISKKKITCPKCGLKYHDKDASHCKSCGHIIYQEFDGN